jgi:hypothetical protein
MTLRKSTTTPDLPGLADMLVLKIDATDQAAICIRGVQTHREANAQTGQFTVFRNQEVRISHRFTINFFWEVLCE